MEVVHALSQTFNDCCLNSYIATMASIALSMKPSNPNNYSSSTMSLVHRLFRDGEVEYMYRTQISTSHTLLKRATIAVADNDTYLHFIGDSMKRFATLDALIQFLHSTQYHIGSA